MEKKTISTPVAVAVAVGFLIIVGIIGFVSINHANGPTLSPAAAQVQASQTNNAQQQAKDEAQQQFSSGGGNVRDPAAAAQKQAQDEAQANAAGSH